MDLEHELLPIERPHWTNDAAIYESSLVEDAVLVFAETGVIRREPALAAIRRENADGRRWAEVQFDDVLTLRLAQDAALLTYRATARWANPSSRIACLRAASTSGGTADGRSPFISKRLCSASMRASPDPIRGGGVQTGGHEGTPYSHA
jgi:hypothetical protein